MNNLVILITLFAFIYDAIKFIFKFIFYIIDKNKTKKWVVKDFDMVTGKVSKLKFIKVLKGDKIVVEYADDKCVFGKIRKTIFFKRVYAPLDMLTEQKIFHKGEKIDTVYIYLRLCCYILFALWIII